MLVCRNITRHATRIPEDHPTPTGQSSNHVCHHGVHAAPGSGPQVGAPSPQSFVEAVEAMTPHGLAGLRMSLDTMGLEHAPNVRAA